MKLLLVGLAVALVAAILANLYSAWCFHRTRLHMRRNAEALERDYQLIRAEIKANVERLLREFMANPDDPKWWQDAPSGRLH